MNKPTVASVTMNAAITIEKPPVTLDAPWDKIKAETAVLAEATKYTKVAQSSGAFPFGEKIDMIDCKGGYTIPPIVIAIIIAAKTQPVGNPPGGFIERSVGTHINTKVYIPPSLNA